MIITTEKVSAMRPCADRFNNFTDQYPNFTGSVKAFLSLDNITYNDKVWVCTRLMSRNQKFYLARACAFSVLEIFENKYPNDKRVRVLLEHLNQIQDVTTLTVDQINEIRTLRSAAASSAASAASAAYAAYAAYAAAYAAASAAYAASAPYAAYAAYAASAAYASRLEQEEFNLIILKQIMELDI